MPVLVPIARSWRRRVAVLVATAAVATLVTSASAPALTAVGGPTTAITSGPSTGTTTASAVAAFTYESAAGATFRCALDDQTARACASSGVTYTNLASGTHVFRVSARVGTGPSGSNAERRWEVDRRAPTVTIAFPTSTRPYTRTTWAAGCGGLGGVCGSAGDAHGVAQVTVAVRDSQGRYFDGTAFTTSAPNWRPADGTDDWHLVFGVPADGRYTVLARATDTIGNETTEASATRRTFSVDTTPPPPPRFAETPDDPSTATTARFRVVPAAGTGTGAGDDDDRAVRLRCTLDAGTARPCGETFVVTRLALGNHCVRATAADALGNTSRPSEFCWDVIVDKGFDVSGVVVGELAPGIERRVDVSVKNPFDFPLRILTLITTIDRATRHSADGSDNVACDGGANFVVTNEVDVSGVPPIVIPRRSTARLSDLGIDTSRWPGIRMLDLTTNQDACKRTTIGLRFAATATKARTTEVPG